MRVLSLQKCDPGSNKIPDRYSHIWVKYVVGSRFCSQGLFCGGGGGERGEGGGGSIFVPPQQSSCLNSIPRVIREP